MQWGNEVNELEQIIEQKLITTVFQPIVSLVDGEILGYEALSRCEQCRQFSNPMEMFEAARRHKKLWELEYMCRMESLKTFSQLKGEGLLFINVDPYIINDEKFHRGFTREFLQQYQIKPENIVLEITERSCIEDISVFLGATKQYKDQNYQIAIDDAGSGYNGLLLITDIGPKYIKLDMELIRGIDSNKLKYGLVKALCNFSLDANIRLVAEGIETKEELSTLIQIGVQYGQGYYLGKPKATLDPINEEAKSIILAENNQYSENIHSIGKVCDSFSSLTIDQLGKDADKLFSLDPDTCCIAVLDKDKPVGIVCRNRFYSKLGTRFGYDLFMNRSIKLMMDDQPLIVSADEDISIVSTKAMSRENADMYDSVIVTRKHQYVGLVSIKTMVTVMGKINIEKARGLNPLTNLPGNRMIQQKLEEILASGEEVTVLYIDIDQFKGYNDRYGIAIGDKFLRHTANCLSKACEGKGNSFIGHIGGDDYLLIVHKQEAKDIAQKIVELFDEGHERWYRGECKDVQQESNGGNGRTKWNGRCTLSIAGVEISPGKYANIYMLMEYGAMVKKQCKAVEDHSIIIQ